MKKLEAVELAYNHTIQIKHKVASGDVLENSRSVCDSRQDLAGESQVVQDIAATFPFTEFKNPDGPCCHADLIGWKAGAPSFVRYDVTEYVYKNQTEVAKSSRRQPTVVECLEDLSNHPEKVQKFCAIVFTPEVKAQYIASLPRVEVPVVVDGKIQTKPEKRQIAVKTTTVVVDGALTELEISPADEVEQQVPVTQAFIEYKGKLYPEDWDGAL